MYLFYVFALLPLIAGFFLWWKDEEVCWWEWCIGAAVGFLQAGIFHAIAYYGMMSDIETWSGEITWSKHFAAWQEYYEYAVYRTETYACGSDKDGHTQYCTREVFDHWEPTTRWHRDYWEAYSNIQTDYDIDEAKFKYFCHKFNDFQTVAGRRVTGEHNSRMIAGDPNDYETHNRTGWVEPITDLHHWENRIKAAPSVFSFVKVSTNVPVFNYPQNGNPWSSERLLGTASKDFNLFVFDQMNARLGPSKKVNVIIVGFDSDDTMLAEYQRAKWIGGKKNDVVLCYGPKWSRVFGWTDSELVKQNLQTILLQHPKNNDLLPLIEAEIRKNYKIKDWKQLDYLTVEPQMKHFVWYWIIAIVVQVGLYIFFHMNEFDKYFSGETSGGGYRPRW